MGCSEVEKGNLFVKNIIVELAKSVGLFVMVSISDMPTLSYWEKSRKNMPREKYEILK